MEPAKRSNTKMRILEVAIDLFAEKGFDQVTIREIAREVGIKGSSIYNHFQGKDDILEEILRFNTAQWDLAYETPGPETVDMPLTERLLFLMQKSFQGLQTPLQVKIFTILSQEQLHNDRIREYFYRDYVLGAREELKRQFDALLENGRIRYPDTAFLANEFHAYIIYKYYENILLRKGDLDMDRLREELLAHIEFFVKAIDNY